MAKTTKVYDIDTLESVLNGLEKEGYKKFNFLQGSEVKMEDRPELPDNHPQKTNRKSVPYVLVIANK